MRNASLITVLLAITLTGCQDPRVPVSTEPVRIVEASGVVYHDGKLYISDTEENRDPGTNRQRCGKSSLKNFLRVIGKHIHSARCANRFIHH